LAFVLFRDGLQIIQGVIRAGADSRPTSTTASPRSLRSRSPAQSSDTIDAGGVADGAVEAFAADQGVTEEMVRWAKKLPLETLVLVEGRVQSPQEDSRGEQHAVRSANVHGAEIEVTRVCLHSLATRRK
jgi:aspartyl/asparaginyl-tRNA synthetase